MPAPPRSLPDRLAHEEREVRRQLSALRRHRRPQTVTTSVAADRSRDVFEAALGASAGEHDEVLWRRLAAKSRALAEALERAREGTYGLCRACGSRIPHQRLEAIPTATLCVPCQEQREAARAA